MKDTRIQDVCAETNSRATETLSLGFEGGEIKMFFDPAAPDGVVVSCRTTGSNAESNLGLVTPAELKRLASMCNNLAQRVERSAQHTRNNR